MNIKKEFIPFIIGLGIVCLNMPIVILLYFLNPDYIGTFATVIVPIECIMIGLTIIYSELKGRKSERKNYKVCDGIIKDTKFKLLNSNWLKAPVVSYIVDGKKYETTANFGINGIASFFIKGKKVKVYYKEENPEMALVNNNIFLIVGTFFIIVGIFIFFI
ncbi:MAG: hypothetical protein IKV94_06150 [Clostridia bacterium]|nr:hypothetical protein [Clostridia bacterium]